jgi:hypothetical protein
MSASLNVCQSWVIGISGVAVQPVGRGFFGLSELHHIDIQEDAIARNRELAKLLDQLLKFGLRPEHETYEFGIGKFFRGGRMLKLQNVKSWVL